MSCPSCNSPTLKVVWSWARYTDNTIGYDDSVMDYQLFVSRSTRYKCTKCGYSFIHHSKKYNTTFADSTEERRLKVVEPQKLATAGCAASEK